MFRKRTLTALGLALLLILLIVPLTMAQATPAVSASDQTVSDGTVTVDSVTSDGAGWIVIHLDDNGSPGAVIGHAAVADGENTDVSVTLDQDITEETTLWAMLHTDAGTEGTYEFPGDDAPVTQDGEVVMQSFVASPAMMEEATATPEAMEEMTPTATTEAMEEMTPTATAEAMEPMTPTATSEAPSTMPETGSTGGNNTGLLLGLAGVLVLLLGGALYWRRTANTKA